MVAQDLIRGLKSESPAQRWRAATRLIDAARSQAADALAALTDALGDEHPFVRWRAGWALASSRRPEAMTRLIHELDHGTSRRRAAAADALTYAPKADPAPLLRALSHDDALVRQSAAEALGRLRYRAAIPRFVALLEDESLWVRRAAARALGHMGDATLVAALSRLLNDESPLVQRSAAYALGAMRAGEAVSALMGALDAPDLQVRRNAAWALGRIGDEAALPKLQALLTDVTLDDEVAHEVEMAVRAIESSGWQKLPDAVGNWLARRLERNP